MLDQLRAQLNKNRLYFCSNSLKRWSELNEENKELYIEGIQVFESNTFKLKALFEHEASLVADWIYHSRPFLNPNHLSQYLTQPSAFQREVLSKYLEQLERQPSFAEYLSHVFFWLELPTTEKRYMALLQQLSEQYVRNHDHFNVQLLLTIAFVLNLMSQMSPSYIKSAQGRKAFYEQVHQYYPDIDMGDERLSHSYEAFCKHPIQFVKAGEHHALFMAKLDLLGSFDVLSEQYQNSLIEMGYEAIGTPRNKTETLTYFEEHKSENPVVQGINDDEFKRRLDDFLERLSAIIRTRGITLPSRDPYLLKRLYRSLSEQPKLDTILALDLDFKSLEERHQPLMDELFNLAELRVGYPLERYASVCPKTTIKRKMQS